MIGEVAGEKDPSKLISGSLNCSIWKSYKISQVAKNRLARQVGNVTSKYPFKKYIKSTSLK